MKRIIIIQGGNENEINQVKSMYAIKEKGTTFDMKEAITLGMWRTYNLIFGATSLFLKLTKHILMLKPTSYLRLSAFLTKQTEG